MVRDGLVWRDLTAREAFYWLGHQLEIVARLSNQRYDSFRRDSANVVGERFGLVVGNTGQRSDARGGDVCSLCRR
jgi:hypothetical protein